MPASDRLSHLLQLADQGPALRAALAEEVADLLTDWPVDYPDSMRVVCEALLAKAARDIDADTRARLRVRLFADPALTARVLPRDLSALSPVEVARRGGDVCTALAHALDVTDSVVRTILADETGVALAAACRVGGIGRAGFSALVMLTGARRDVRTAYALLDVFDMVPMEEATRRLGSWRHPAPGAIHAAA